MPLHEIPSNINFQHNASQADNLHTQIPPLAVQRMLKSATEFGDVGILAPRPLRLHRSETYSSHRSRSTVQTSRTHYSQQRYRPPKPRKRQDWQRHAYTPEDDYARNSSYGMPDHRYRQHPQAASLRSLPSPRNRPRRRIPTYRPTPSHISDTHVRYVQDGRHSSMTSVSSNPASSVGSIVPHYYDYSESFYGSPALHPYMKHNDTIHESDPEECLNIDRPDEEYPKSDIQQQELVELVNSNVLDLALPDVIELATPHNRRPSEHSSHTIKWQSSTENTRSSHTTLDQPSSDELKTPNLSMSALRDSKGELGFDKRLSEDLTSHDKSTIESLLDEHIECLGLGNKQNHLRTPQKRLAGSQFLPQLPSVLDDTASPFSLLDRHIESLGLQRSKSPVKTTSSRPSYGWLPLPSETYTSTTGHNSQATIASGDYADVESGVTVKKFNLCRHSSLNLSPSNPSQSSDEDMITDVKRKYRSKSESIKRNRSQKHRKLKIHMKATNTQPLSPSSSEWVSTTNSSIENANLLEGKCLAHIPISVVDGFAELSGQSADISQQSLPLTHQTSCKPPDTWSSIVAAMPLPSGHKFGVKRDNSNSSLKSQSRLNVVNPLNTSRSASRLPSIRLRTAGSAPRLRTPVLGPALRASHFDFHASIEAQNPRYKQSSFIETDIMRRISLDENPNGRVRAARKFNSWRHIMPDSLRSFNFSPRRSEPRPAQTPMVAENCRKPRPRSYPSSTCLPETIAMSDFAYRKHKLLEKLREWCRRRCGKRGSHKRALPPGGFLV